MTARHRLRAEVASELDDIDALLTPTVPDVAPPVGALPTPGFDLGRYTRATNVTGHPSLTVPNGTDDDGLPVGLQLVGSAFEDARLLGVGECVARTIGTA